MRPFLEQNYYEILEVSPDTAPQGLERAYRIARATYQPGSTAAYSVFSDEDSGEILRRIEEAYAVLSDGRLRREYDARLRREGGGSRPGATLPGRGTVSRPREEDSEAPAGRAAPLLPRIEFELDEPVEPEDGIYDGPVLRRIRMSRGIELEEISALTKVGERALQLIEANRYHELPAPVYLQGFLKEYAKCLRLDPKRVTETYMERYWSREKGTT
jgi:curved DNA-binding protein CbpA